MLAKVLLLQAVQGPERTRRCIAQLQIWWKLIWAGGQWCNVPIYFQQHPKMQNCFLPKEEKSQNGKFSGTEDQRYFMQIKIQIPKRCSLNSQKLASRLILVFMPPFPISGILETSSDLHQESVGKVKIYPQKWFFTFSKIWQFLCFLTMALCRQILPTIMKINSAWLWDPTYFGMN